MTIFCEDCKHFRLGQFCAHPKARLLPRNMVRRLDLPACWGERAIGNCGENARHFEQKEEMNDG